MKTIPAGLATHLQGEVTRLASLFTVTRKDGVTFRFTDHDRDLVHAGQTYKSRAGYERTAVAGTGTSGPSASAVTSCTTGRSTGAGSGSPCVAGEPWAICSPGRIRPDSAGRGVQQAMLRGRNQAAQPD